MTETLLHMAVSMVLAIVLIFLCRGLIEDLLGVSPETLLLSEGAVVLLGVCAAVFLVTGLVPGILFARIPVTSVVPGRAGGYGSCLCCSCSLRPLDCWFRC